MSDDKFNSSEFKADLDALGAAATEVLQDVGIGVSPGEPTIQFMATDKNAKEIMRLDHRGMTYRGTFIEDAGQAYRAFMETMQCMPYSVELRHLRSLLNATKVLMAVEDGTSTASSEVVAYAKDLRASSILELQQLYREHPNEYGTIDPSGPVL